MTKRQENEVERIKTRYGVVRTRDNGHVTLVYVHGDGGSAKPTLVIALDLEGRRVAARKVRRVKITDIEVVKEMVT